MLPVSDSDAFLIEVQQEGPAQVILIDGGRTWEDGDRILRHLSAYYDGRIDHLILSHIDSEHAGGLLHVVENLPREKLGQAWVQDMGKHGVNVERAIQMARRFAQEAQSTPVRSVAAHLADSVETVQELIELLQAKGVPVQEAFADSNDRIGPFEVLGPTQEFFKACIGFYGDNRQLDSMVEQGVAIRRRKGSGLTVTEPDEALEQAVDDPETAKQASLILLLEYEGDKYLFPGDAGRRAFRASPKMEKMRGLHLLKVPNHGSKHNLDPELLDFFKPALAYVSASGIGSTAHPDLIAALEDRGAVIYTSTGSGNVWHRRGQVPPRVGYRSRRPQ
jgi:beta-lactamase superfamily II metal-dependent hydrolase